MVGWCSMGTFNDPCWFCQFEHVIFENVPRHDVVHQQWSGATDDGLVGSLSPGQTWNMGSWQMKVMSQQKAGMFASTGCSKISKYNIIYIYIHIFIIYSNWYPWIIFDLWFSWQNPSFIPKNRHAFRSQIPRNALGGFGAKCSQCPEPQATFRHDRWLGKSTMNHWESQWFP